jgi:hypothetical protein
LSDREDIAVRASIRLGYGLMELRSALRFYKTAKVAPSFSDLFDCHVALRDLEDVRAENNLDQLRKSERQNDMAAEDLA